MNPFFQLPVEALTKKNIRKKIGRGNYSYVAHTTDETEKNLIYETWALGKNFRKTCTQKTENVVSKKTWKCSCGYYWTS